MAFEIIENTIYGFLKQFFVLKKWQEKRMEERHLKNAKDLTKRKSKRINYEKYFI